MLEINKGQERVAKSIPQLEQEKTEFPEATAPDDASKCSYPGALCMAAGGRAKAILSRSRDAVIVGANAAKSSAASTLRFGLKTLGGDGFLVSSLSKVVPFLGATKRYADAWLKYHQGVKADDKAAIQEGRIGCLVALADVNFDLALLGGGSLFGRLAKPGLKNLFRSAYLGWFARVLTPVRKDPVLELAKRAANTQKGQAIADFFLNNLQPNPSA